MAILMNGDVLSRRVRTNIKNTLDKRRAAGARPPHLAAVLVGAEAASSVYVQHKVRDCQEVGMASSVHRFSRTAKASEVLACLEVLNNDPGVDGIIVQLPLPPHIQKEHIIQAIDPRKDVDGFHYENFGRLCVGDPRFIPATPYGILLLLEHHKIATRGRHVVVVGRSYIVGLPMSIVLTMRGALGDATVTIAHGQTSDLSSFTRLADMVVVAVGQPNLISADMIKQGSVVIDVGITRVEDEKSGKKVLRGDVDFASVSERASYITPVPRGVGPMTRAALLMNTLKAAQRST